MGMELRAVMEYSAKFNYSLTITNDEEYWGEIFENWTGTGVLGGVVTDKYDIGFSKYIIQLIEPQLSFE